MATTNTAPKTAPTRAITKVVLEPGMKIALEQNGVPLTAEQLNGENLVVTKAGDSLMVTMPDGSQTELVDFFITDDVTLEGDFWDLPADSGLVQTAGGVVAQPAAMAQAADTGVLGEEAIATDANATDIAEGVAEVVAETAPAVGAGGFGGVLAGLAGLGLAAGGGGGGGGVGGGVVAQGITYTLTAVAGPQSDDGAGTPVALYKASGVDAGQLLGAMVYNSETGKYSFLDKTNFTGVIVAKLVDGDSAPDYISEATGAAADFGMDTVLMSAAAVNSANSAINLTISTLTTAAAKNLGITAEAGDATITIGGDGTLDAQTVVNTNKALAMAFNILDVDGNPVDISTQTVNTTVNLDGAVNNSAVDGTDAASAYGRALALISNAEKASDLTVAQMADDIAQALKVESTGDTVTGSLTSTSDVTASVQEAIAAGAALAQASGQMRDSQVTELLKSTMSISMTMAVRSTPTNPADTYLNAQEPTVDLVINGTFTAGQTLKLLNGSTAVAFEVGATPVVGSTGYAIEETATSLAITVARSDLSDSDSRHLLKAELTTPDVAAPITSNVLPIVVDSTMPTVGITSNASALKIGETAIITFEFSEVPTDFTVDDIEVTGGELSELGGSGSTRIATFTPNEGVTTAASITVGAGYKDLAGNTGIAGLTPEIAIDTIAPTVDIASSVGALKAGETATITFTFSEAPMDFAAEDVTLVGGQLGTINVGSDPKIYTAEFTPDVNSTAAASITLGAGYTDAAGNPGAAGVMPEITINTIVPTVDIASSVAALKAGETAVITFTFSEAPTGFTADDVALVGGALTDPMVDGNDPTIYTAEFTPAANFTNAASITVGTGYTNAAGNAGLAGMTPVIAIDTEAPYRPDVPQNLGVSNGATSAEALIGAVKVGAEEGSSVAVTFTSAADSSKTLTKTVAGTAEPQPVPLTVEEQAFLGDGVINVSVVATDAAGNAGETATTSFYLDTTAPSPMLAIADGEDTFVNSVETAVTLVYTDITLEEGDAIRLRVGTGSATVFHTVTDTDVLAGSVNLTVDKTKLGGDGEKLITVETQDFAGNVAISDPFTVMLDTTGPTITTTSLSAAENGTAIGSVAGDTDTDGITWALGSTGADTSQFVINGAGELSFRAGKDFEAPGSAATSNTYAVSVKGTDSQGNSTTKSINVTVTNVNEAPSYVGTSGGTASDDNYITIYTNVVTSNSDLQNGFTDPDGSAALGGLTYTLAPDSAELPTGLTLNADGSLSGTTTAAAGNVTITVRATDGGVAGDSTTQFVDQSYVLNLVAAPALTTALSSAVTNLDVRSKIVFSVGETVTANEGGTITLTDLGGGTGFQNDTITNTQEIDITDANRVQILGTGADTKIIIDPQFDLDLSSNYSLAVSDGAFLGSTTGLNSVAFTTVEFSTVTPAATIAAAVEAQEMSEITGALQPALKWFDLTNVGNFGNNSGVQLDFVSSNYAAALKLVDDQAVVEGENWSILQNFDGDDLVYMDLQDNTLTNAADFFYSAIFDSGEGIVGLGFGMNVPGTGETGLSFLEIEIAEGVPIPDPREVGLLIVDITANGWSNTGMVIVG